MVLYYPRGKVPPWSSAKRAFFCCPSPSHKATFPLPEHELTSKIQVSLGKDKNLEKWLISFLKDGRCKYIQVCSFYTTYNYYLSLNFTYTRKEEVTYMMYIHCVNPRRIRARINFITTCSLIHESPFSLSTQQVIGR